MELRQPLPARAGRYSRPLLPSGWLFYALFAGFPIWWALGLGSFIWPIMAVPMALWLIARRRDLVVPRGFGLWVVFLVLAVASFSQLQSVNGLFTAGYRLSLYLSATVLFVYVLNTESILSSRSVVYALTCLWVFIVIGGFLGMLMPDRTIRSPVEILLSRHLPNVQFVTDLTELRFAEIHTFFDVRPRPSAPFPYANEWGLAFALLAPFALCALQFIRRGSAHLAVTGILLLSVIPLVLSGNRAAIAAIGLGILYALVRFALRGRPKAFLGMLGVLLVAATLIVATPLRGIVLDRFEQANSNAGRASLYRQSIDQAKQAPLLGYGAPLSSGPQGLNPAIGTQGQLWQVLVSYGFPATIVFVAWMALVCLRSRRFGSSIRFAAHVSLCMALVMMPLYGYLPSQIQIIMVAAALAWREGTARRPLFPGALRRRTTPASFDVPATPVG